MKNSILTLIIFFCCCFTLSAQTDHVIRNYMQLSKADGLSHNYVTCITEDIYNRIWIGTAGGLDIFDSNHVHKLEGYEGIHINTMYNTGTGMLIGTPPGLLKSTSMKPDSLHGFSINSRM